MRKLTIKRKKSFVASLVKLKVYIEDSAGELDITGIKCRLLGTLANGEEKAFEISENAAKVFVIADKTSRDYCYDCRSIPAGDEDVYLEGKNVFNPAVGNAYRFDGDADEDVAKRRKESKKIGLIVLITALVVGITAGFIIGRAVIGGKRSSSPKEFSVDDGFSITLTEAFSEEAIDGRKIFSSKTDVVAYLCEKQTGIIDLSALTVKEYSELVKENNEFMKDAEFSESDGICYMEYDSVGTDGKTYTYLTTFYKTSDSFWIIQFATRKSDYEARRSQFVEWAKTVRFDD